MLIRRSVATVAAIASLSFSAAAFAPFHFSVTKTLPVAAQVLTASPERLQYWFSEAPAEGPSSIKLMQGTTEIEVSKTTVVAKDKTMFVTPVKPLAPGDYKMSWRAAGDDGHAMSGDTAFSVAPPKQ